MGAAGSGGHNRLSDAEKIRRGTFDKRTSEAAQAEKAGRKVVVGPWLNEIPDPELPLNEIGRKKYDELARSLFETGKLTMATKMLAEQVAVLFQQMHQLLSAGKSVPTNLSEKIQRVIFQLGIAENAPQIAAPQGQKRKFAHCGFSSKGRKTF
jgi:hypothetical protein